MRLWKHAVAVAALALTTSANAAFINHENYVSDTSTGLDWLNLSVTTGQAYSDALTLNPGWQYASNSAVESLFTSVFTNYADTNSRNHTAKTTDIESTLNQQVGLFESLMGYSDDLAAYDLSYGFYGDEDGLLRMMGTGTRLTGFYSIVYSTEYTANYTSLINEGRENIGVYLVRSSSLDGTMAGIAKSTLTTVPVPAAAWLFGSGLVGLIGVSRRKKQ